MSVAISIFIREHLNIISITIKFSAPGHSCNQEIDSEHTCIENILNKTEYYSPLYLLRFLLKVSAKKSYKIIQLKKDDFRDYKTFASLYN